MTVIKGFMRWSFFTVILVLVTLPVQGENKTGLLLQEKETYSVYLIDGKVSSITTDHLLGVGLNTEKQKRFNVTLIDKLPRAVKTNLEKRGFIEVKALDGKALRIPYTIKNKDQVQELKFTLKNVPAVDLKKAGQCCDCDGSCGTACGVEFGYQTFEEVDPSEWAEVKYSVFADKLKPGVDNPVSVSLTIKNKSFDELEVALILHSNDPRATYNLITVPPGFETKTSRDGVWAVSKIKATERVSFQFVIAINPSTQEPLELKDLFRITGNSKNLRHPEIEAQGWKVSERTNGLKVLYYGGVRL